MGISQFIKDKAMELGFSACGIAEVALILTNGSRKATMLE